MRRAIRPLRLEPLISLIPLGEQPDRDCLQAMDDFASRRPFEQWVLANCGDGGDGYLLGGKTKVRETRGWWLVLSLGRAGSWQARTRKFIRVPKPCPPPPMPVNIFGDRTA